MEITETFRDELVEIGFTAIDGDYTYMDRFTILKKDFDLMTETDITKMEQDKYDAWYLMMTTPPIEPTKEELQALLASANQQKGYWEAEISKLEIEIATKG